MRAISFLLKREPMDLCSLYLQAEKALFLDSDSKHCGKALELVNLCLENKINLSSCVQTQ